MTPGNIDGVAQRRIDALGLGRPHLFPSHQRGTGDWGQLVTSLQFVRISRAHAAHGFIFCERKGLTDIADIVPWIRFLVSDGWWMTGQTILVNGGYTTK